MVAFQRAACLGSTLEIRHDQRGSGDALPKAAGLKRSQSSWCLLCMWNVKLRLLLPGSARFRSRWGFFDVQVTKSKLLFWKSFPVSEKALSYTALAALRPSWLQGAGGNLLSILRSKAHEGILKREGPCDSQMLQQ